MPSRPRRRAPILAAAALAAAPLLFPDASFSQTARTWQGGTSDNFSTSSRWSPAGKPTGTDIARFNNSATYNVTFTGNESFGTLDLQFASVVTFVSTTARTATVTSVSITGPNTSLRLSDFVTVNSTGNTTVNGANAFLTVDGGDLTTNTLTVSDGLLRILDPNSSLFVSGGATIGGQNTTGRLQVNAASPVTFNGALTLAPAGAGNLSTANVTFAGGSTITLNNNLTVGTLTDADRQGILTLSGAGTSVSQVGLRSITLGHDLQSLPQTGEDTTSRITVNTGATFSSGTGAITIQERGKIDVAGGTFTANGPVFVESGGLLSASAGTFNLNADSSVSPLGGILLTGGAFTANADLDVSGFFTNTNATLAFTPGANLSVSAGGAFSTNRPLTLPALTPFTVSGAGALLRVTDGNPITVAASSSLSVNTGAFATADRLVIGSATGTTATVTIDGSGTALAAAGGTTTIAAGTLTVRNTANASFAGVSLGHASGLTATLAAQSGSHTFILGPLDIATTNTPGASAFVNLTGANTDVTLLSAAPLTIGATTAGAGTLTVNSGSTFNTSTGPTRVNPTGTLNVGTGTFIANGPVTIDGGTLAVSTAGALVLSAQNLTVRNTIAANLGRFSLDPGASITVDNATLGFNSLTPNGGAINFLSGAVLLNQSTFNGALLTAILGPAATLLPNHRLQITGTATLNAQLILDGGTFITNALAGNTPPILRSGLLHLSGSPLTISSTGPLGPTPTLPPNTTLAVLSTTTVDPAAVLHIPGGTLSPTGALTNNGEIVLDSPLARITGPASFTNNALLRGDGRIESPVFSNASTGQVRIGTNQRLLFTGSSLSNAGSLLLTGGTAEFTSPFANTATGTVSGRGTLISPALANAGQLLLTGGPTDLFGPFSNSAGSRVILSGNATATFYNPVTLQPGSEFRVSAGSAAVFFASVTAAANTFTGPGEKHFEAGQASLASLRTPGSTTVHPAATLTTTSIRESALTLSSSTATLTPNSPVSQLSSLTLEGSATLDLTNNALLLNYTTTSPLPQIHQLISTAAGPDLLWTGAGITSSAARGFATHQTPGAPTALGYSESSLYKLRTGNPFYADLPLDDTTLIIAHTFVGDANLDGAVNDTDADILITHYGQTGALWTNADFTYDGRVDDRDLDLLTATTGYHNDHIELTPAALTRLQSLRATAPIPEPAATLTASAVACLIAARRKTLRRHTV